MDQIELLVTVKAYPNISKRYGEVVCVAGIRTDVEPVRWVRLYPIHFRDLEFGKRFEKYRYVTLKAKPHSGDARPESMRPNTDSFELGDKVDTRKKWAARRSIVEPLLAESMCEIQRQQKLDRTSIGVFRPEDVSEFTVDTVDAEWESGKKGVIDQPIRGTRYHAKLHIMDGCREDAFFDIDHCFALFICVLCPACVLGDHEA